MRFAHPPPPGSLSPRPNRPPPATPHSVAAFSSAGRATPCRTIPCTNRTTFSDPRNAAAFLPRYLGGPLPALVDWNSLVLLPSSFTDARMAGPEAGLLFSAKIGGSDAPFYILWEHQRTDAPLMGLHLLSYMVRIWKSQVRESGPSARLAPIHPLALAQEKDNWKTSTHFPDLFGFPPEEWRAVREAASPQFHLASERATRSAGLPSFTLSPRLV